MTVIVGPLRVDQYQIIPFGSIGLTYIPFTNTIQHNWNIIDFNNTTDVDISISFDGTTNNLFIPTSSFRIYDIETNGMTVSLNTQVFIKGSAIPTKGLVSMTGLFVRGN